MSEPRPDLHAEIMRLQAALAQAERERDELESIRMVWSDEVAEIRELRAALDRARGEIGLLRDAVRRKDDICAALHRTLETIRDVEVATRAPCYLALIEAALAGRG